MYTFELRRSSRSVVVAQPCTTEVPGRQVSCRCSALHDRRPWSPGVLSLLSFARQTFLVVRCPVIAQPCTTDVPGRQVSCRCLALHDRRSWSPGVLSLLSLARQTFLVARCPIGWRRTLFAVWSCAVPGATWLRRSVFVDCHLIREARYRWPDGLHLDSHKKRTVNIVDNRCD